MKERLFATSFEKPDASIYRAIKRNWDGISKPLDGLGEFENVVCKIGAIQGSTRPKIDKRVVLVYCSDNGIVEEGVSQSGKEVTKAVAEALGKGASSVCRLASAANVDVCPVDAGIDCEETILGLENRKIARGTKNFLREPAMTEEQTLRAIELGVDCVKRQVERGYTIIATGEMGIGNTTTATAVLCALLGLSPASTVGRGAGLDDAGLRRKTAAIERGLARYDLSAFRSEKERALAILRTFGGFDVAALAGTFIGGALARVPIAIDGLISATAAVCADKLVPGVREFMLPSHRGRERGVDEALQALGLSPLIEGKMALGEGTGAVMLFPLLDLVFDFYRNAARFADVNIEEYERFTK